MNDERPIRRLFGGAAVLGIGTLFQQVLGFALLAITARRLGPDPVGSFAFALSLVGYFAIPANFGVTALATRDLAQHPDRAREIMAEVVVLHSLLVLLPYGLVVATAPILGADELSVELMPIVALGFVLEAFSLQWVLYGRSRFAVIAAARAAGSLVNFLMVVFLVTPGSGAEGARWLAIASTVGFAVTSALTSFAVLTREGLPPLRFRGGALARRLRTGAFLGMSGVMISIYYSLDSVMLGYMRTTFEVGQYAVAYRLPLALIAFAALWGSVLFPYASYLGIRQTETLRVQLGFFTSVAAVAALPMAAGAALVGEALMPQLFGDKFAPAGTPFIILAVAAAVVTLSMSTGIVAAALGEERRYVWALAAGAAINIALNIPLIPLFGMTGAACATVAAELVVFALVWRRVTSRIGHVELEWWRIGRALAATAVMVPAVLAASAVVGAVGQVAVGAAVYALAALAFGAVRRAELVLALRPTGAGTA